MAKKHLSKQNDHISKIAEDYGFFDWKTIWDDTANGSLKQKRGDPNVLFKGDKTRKGRKGDEVKIPAKNIKEDSKATDNDYVYQVPRKKLQLNLRVLNVDFTPIKQAQYELAIEGREGSYSGKTNDQGEIIAEDIPLAAQRGKLSVRVSPQDANVAGPQAEGNQGDANAGQPAEGAIEGDVPVTWELKIGGINPIMEEAPNKWCISGVQQRLNNLGINSGPVDGKLGVCTRSAVEAFQSMFDLDKDGKPGQNQTQPKLRNLHDKNTLFGPPPKAAAGITPVPKDKRLKTTTGDIGHVAPAFDGTFFNTLVIRPEYRISLSLGEIENLFAEKPDTELGRMARFQVMGLYYFPLGHRVSTTPGEYGQGWHKTLAHVKTKIFGFPGGADAAKVDDGIKLWLKTRVVHGGVLPKPADDPRKPQKDNFRKIRLPGGFTHMDSSEVTATGNDDSANGYDFSFGKHMYPIENLYYRDNPVLGKIPLIAKVEKKVGSKWRPAKDVWVYFRLVEPYDLPEFDYSKKLTEQLNRPPLHKSSIGDNMTLKKRTKGAGPKKGYDEVEGENAKKGDPKADPQSINCHKDYGGKRGEGNLNDGTDVKDVIFKVGDVPGFNSDHSDTRKVPHPHFPAAEAVNDPQHPHAVKVKTNEQGEAGVIFMPSRCGGDRYRIRAYVGPPTLPSDGTGPDGVRVETGTFIVWRNVRISRYVRQEVTGVAATLLNDAAAYGFGTQNDYLKRVYVVDNKGNNVGLPPFNLEDKAEKKAAMLANKFEGVVAQFARAFCEVELDPDAQDPLTNDEWKGARDQAIEDGQVAANLAGVDVDTELLCLKNDNTITVNNSAVNLPMLTPLGYYLAAHADSGITDPPLDVAGTNLDPGWIRDVVRVIYPPMLLGFHRHLSHNGFLPGLTVVHGGYGHTWQLLGYNGMGGVALSYRACYDWGGSAMYLKKVQRPTSPPKPNLVYLYDFTSTATHEIGHLLFRVHARGRNKKHRKTGGTWNYYYENHAPGYDDNRHDDIKDHICVMSYKTCEGLFCAKCLFAMCGWDISRI